MHFDPDQEHRIDRHSSMQEAHLSCGQFSIVSIQLSRPRPARTPQASHRVSRTRKHCLAVSGRVFSPLRSLATYKGKTMHSSVFVVVGVVYFVVFVAVFLRNVPCTSNLIIRNSCRSKAVKNSRNMCLNVG
jgi:hypothetical protein